MHRTFATLVLLILSASAPRAQAVPVDSAWTGRPDHEAGPPPPYPVIFVHGLISNDQKWDGTISHLEAEGWGEPFTYHIDLNASESTNAADDIVMAPPVPYHQFPEAAPDSLLELGSTPPRPYATTESRLFAVNFKAYAIPETNQMAIHSNRLIEGQSESNCSAIVKQGKALGSVIADVLAWTGSDRVILVGHSMGGLAIREYLQRTGPSGEHAWWADPGSSHVAAAITTGTPHQGSNVPDFGVFPCPDSEALRDIRTSYITTGETAPYLYGGPEAMQRVWHNSDVTADGDEDDMVVGLNEGDPGDVWARDNQEMPLPRDVRYYYIFSGWVRGTDGAVVMRRQYLTEEGPDGQRYFAPYGMADGRRVDTFHKSQMGDFATIEAAIRAVVAE